jgi:hydrogenase-1 operon protein HyaF
MSGLDSIPVHVEGAGEFRTENLRPLLKQLEQALVDLSERGQAGVIDLGAMPFSARDEDDLRSLLGRGEVTATLTAFGPTLVEETAVPGVWLVEHKDAEERRLTLHIEITRIPEILVVPAEDLAEGLAALRRFDAAEGSED